jgi:hypothetical protein
MSNPWIKKNPVMSLFLSATNSWLSRVRGHTLNAIKRQQKAALKAAFSPPKKRRRRPNRRP